jgi:glyoxylase-like metal-dependent hydrolase (beta-lactamase superfamily II)
MRQSLKRLLDSLPGDTHVFPGHGEATSIDYEKRYNPFV